MDREFLNIFIKLALSSWKSIKNDTFCWFRFFNFFIDDINNNLIADKSTRFNNSSDSFDKIFIESTSNGAFKDLSDLITCGDVIIVQIFSQKFSISTFSDSRCSKEEEEFLFASWKVGKNSICKLKHRLSINYYAVST